jgi:hypothetical protein
MLYRAKSSFLASFTFAVVLPCLPANSHSQSLDAILANADKARIDLAALHVAQSIQEEKLSETEAKVLSSISLAIQRVIPRCWGHC